MSNDNRVLYCRAELSPDNDMQLRGKALVYGDIAKLSFGTEVIDAGAFGDLSNADLILNRQHDRSKPLARTGGGGLQVIDSPTELRLQADLPDTPTGREAITLVRNGILRGFSIEFVATREYVSNREIHIAEGRLYGVALVDKPAYPESQVFRHEILEMEPNDCGLLNWKRMMVRRGAF